MSRLVDADVLIENLREIKALYGVPMTNRDEQMIHWIIGHIKEQPTAYDVEKVVEEVKKLSFEWLGDIRTCDVIRLVRKGGVK